MEMVTIRSVILFDNCNEEEYYKDDDGDDNYLLSPPYTSDTEL